MEDGLLQDFTPLILAFDTTSQRLSIALNRGNHALGALSLHKKGKHSVDFMPALDRLLISAGVTIEQINLICCATGPGSFTGIRIGMATAEALAFALQIPVIGFSSMAAEAHLFRAVHQPVLISYDARGGRLYAGLYCAGEEILPPTQLMDGELADWLEPHRVSQNALIVIGDGAEHARKQLSGVVSSEAIRDGNAIARYANRSVALCDLGLAYAASSFDMATYSKYKLYNMEPLYLAATQAERMKRERETSLS